MGEPYRRSSKKGRVGETTLLRQASDLQCGCERDVRGDVMGQLDAGGRYVIDEEDRRRFREDGYVHLAGVLSEDEVAEVEVIYDRFLRREIEVPGKDFCDMAGDYGRDPSDFSIVNVMLPRRYFPEWQGNVYEWRTADIARQLCGEGMTIDYDQLLAKQPHKTDAVFAWHQDMAYWPETEDRRTATFWLAVDDSTVANGCMRFVPATTHEGHLRPHAPVYGGRGESHALGTELLPGDDVVTVPIARGDCTVHNERVMHGSGGNDTDGYRRAYVLAYRSEETVKIERQLGFTHSHNDQVDVLDHVGVAGETRDGQPMTFS
jgi:phytanoyl-CoA hydroxylase